MTTSDADRSRPSPAHAGPDFPEVPAWLDEIEGDRALAWVAEHNARTSSSIEVGERFEQIRSGIEEILDSPDRIPGVSQAAGMLYNVWTDAEHPRGLWRRTTWESYRAGAPDGASVVGAPDDASTVTGATGSAGPGATNAGPAAGSAGPGTTDWEVLLDLDALGREEGVTWVWHGAQVLRTGELAGCRALVTLSDGGSDTDVTREFDLEARRFIPTAEGGFHREASKGFLSWADDEGDSVLSLDDVGPDSLSPAGYPRQVRRLRRGQDAAQAEVLLTASATDNGADAHRDRWGRTWLITHPDFYTEELWLLPDGAATLPASASSQYLAASETVPAPGALHIDVPASAEVSAAWDFLLISLREDWTPAEDSPAYPAGSLLAAPLEGFLAGSREVQALFTPTASASLTSFAATKHHLVLSLLDDCVAALEVLTPPPASEGTWERQPLDLGVLSGPKAVPPADHAAPRADAAAPASDDAETDPSLLRPGRALLSVSARAVDAREDDRLWLTVSSFTQPSTLAVAELDAQGRLGAIDVLRQAPERFDASGLEVSQHVAVSADGTRIPYFQVGKPWTDDDDQAAPAPTILYGYGGFEVSLGVGYMPVTGKAWLERGGTYVIANIRGGGEYGPAWHRAGLKGNRHRVYEDFAAVARALVDRGVTTRERLAVLGGSNGGLLVGNMLTTYPELVGAVLCEVPLLDMSRYTHLLAGASWEAEYGDPDDPEQWETLRTISPFHLLKPGRSYPPVLFVTSTRDDRVHPAHARTMAYRMESLGQSVTYFENSEGGHGRASTNAQRARLAAIEHEFAWRTLTRTDA